MNEKTISGYAELMPRRRLLREAGRAALVLSVGASGSAGKGIAAPKAKKLRIAVVGGGFGASFYWHEHPECEVTAVSDLRDDRQKLLADRYRCTNVYGEFHPMLKDPKVDAVAIFTPAPDHVKHCVDVLNAGKHVVCAVPAAMTLEECQQLLDAVKRSGLIYMQAETSCFHAATMAARKLRIAREFGSIYFTSGEYLHDVSDSHPGGKRSGLKFDAQGKPTWRYGIPGALYPTHATGPVVFVTGERLTEVACIAWGREPNPYPGNRYNNNPFQNFTFLAKTTGGHACRIAIHNYFGGRGDIAERAEYWGTKMVFLEPRFGQPALVSREDEPFEAFPVDDNAASLPEELRKYIKSGHGGSEVFITNEFVNAIIEQRRPIIDVEAAITFCAPGICAFQSALHEGEWIKVPDFGWHR